VGKSTLIRQVLDDRPAASFHSVAADPQVLPTASSAVADATQSQQPPSPEWLQAEWVKATERASTWNLPTASDRRHLRCHSYW
jgi:hypothetical protein